jgi:hypothetical protein
VEANESIYIHPMIRSVFVPRRAPYKEELLGKLRTLSPNLSIELMYELYEAKSLRVPGVRHPDGWKAPDLVVSNQVGFDTMSIADNDPNAPVFTGWHRTHQPRPKKSGGIDEDNLLRSLFAKKFCDFQKTRVMCHKPTMDQLVHFVAKTNELNRYERSNDIMKGLLTRLKRLVDVEAESLADDIHGEMEEVRNARIADRLCLDKISLKMICRLQALRKFRRISLRSPVYVSDEMEMAEVIHQACLNGILHLRTKGCKCKKTWRIA